ncbi:MAG: hypothetical protein QM778_38680 [Myxococcales bacterium]
MRWSSKLLSFSLVAACSSEPSSVPPRDDGGRDAASDASADTASDASEDPADASTPSSTDSAGDGACDLPPASAQGRMFGADILDVNPGESFEDNLAQLAELRGRYLTLHLPWTALETTAGAGTTSGTLVDPGTPSVLATFDALAAQTGSLVSLTLRPVDATGKTVPSDLAQLAFDDPKVAARFQKVVDYVLTRIAPEHLVNLMIGNEVDGFNPGTEANFWPAYGQFLASVHSYLHAKYPNLPVGFTATLPALTDAARKTADGWPAQQVMLTWADQVDVVGVTYYPLEADFTMRDPTQAAVDLAALTASVPASKPIHVQEIGYASSTVNDSSDAQQARFFCEVMRAWDAHAARIPRLAVLRLNDVSEQKAMELAGPYGVGTAAFKEYLRTLGLRTADGKTKPAFRVLRTQTAAREL